MPLPPAVPQPAGPVGPPPGPLPPEQPPPARRTAPPGPLPGTSDPRTAVHPRSAAHRPAPGSAPDPRSADLPGPRPSPGPPPTPGPRPVPGAGPRTAPGPGQQRAGNAAGAPSRVEETVTLRAVRPPAAGAPAGTAMSAPAGAPAGVPPGAPAGAGASPAPPPRGDETVMLRPVGDGPAPALSLAARGRAARRRAAQQGARGGARPGERAPTGPAAAARTAAGAGPAAATGATTAAHARSGAPRGGGAVTGPRTAPPAGPAAATGPRTRTEARRAARARKDSRGAVISRVAGELFITLGVLMLLFVTYQLWWSNIRAQQIAAEEAKKLQERWARAERAPDVFSPGKGFAIMYIPKLDVKVPVAEGIDKHNVLDRGLVGHYGEAPLKTAMPWEKKGNFAVAGHRNTHGEPFRYINRLKPGDEIVVETQDTYFVYEMAKILPQTSPSNVAVIDPVPAGSGFTGPGRYITLTTCTPEFTSTYRMIVWGKMVEERPRDEGKPDALVG
ncbi:class E sortase [Streptomyces pactum]|uniref:Class E sortase n=1 Tax=Streptomyces pactum TaxID=68249 RepID=A0ABS0NLA6_9ACTN|nr:class E sortase [Streptomyces pactum]MBH5335983.1 class E sortase [Streptomyces pactum]